MADIALVDSYFTDGANSVQYNFTLASYSEIDTGLIAVYQAGNQVRLDQGVSADVSPGCYFANINTLTTGANVTFIVTYNGLPVDPPADPTGTADLSGDDLLISFTLNPTMADSTKVVMMMFNPLANMESSLPGSLEYHAEDHSYSYTFSIGSASSDIEFRVYYDTNLLDALGNLRYIATATTTASPTAPNTIPIPKGNNVTPAVVDLIVAANEYLSDPSAIDINANDFNLSAFLFAVKSFPAIVGYNALGPNYSRTLSTNEASDLVVAWGSSFKGAVGSGGMTVATPGSNGKVALPALNSSLYVAVADATDWSIDGSTALLRTNGSSITVNNGPPTSSGFTINVPMTDGSVETLFFNAGGSAVVTRVTSGVACFLADAPVLTPAGYRRIASLRNGDLVVTSTGAVVPIQAVTARPVAASSAVNPYVIPKGRFGALRDLAISPDHKVAVGDKMISAASLGLAQANMSGRFTYYNLELPNHENMVVAGVTVESQFPIKRVTVTMAEFREMLVAKYGRLTPAILSRVQKKVRLLTDGRVIVPVDKRTA